MAKTQSDKQNQNRLLRKNFDCIILTCCIAVIAIVSCLFIYESKLNNPPIRSDGYGYYAYLPTIFIDHNLSFSLAINNQPTPFVPNTNIYGIGIDKSNSRTFDKYGVGTAMLETPFFLVADTFTRLTGELRTGYGQPYQIAVVASGIFYLCLGSLLIYITIRRLFGKRIGILTTITIVFATNVFHYGTYDNSFSQIYSYAAVALYLYLILRLMDLVKEDLHKYIWLIATGLCLGLIASIRAPDVIVALLLFPVLFKHKTVKNFIIDISLVTVSCLIVLMPTLLYLKHTTGSIFTNSYEVFPVLGFHEGFTHLRNPQIIGFLLSVRKGLFFWSPVLVLAFASIVVLIKRIRGFGIALALVLCLQIYLCASWWTWFFGGSFESRPFVDMMPLLAIALAAGIFYASRWISIKLISVLLMLLVLLNLVLMYSYWLGYIPYDKTNWSMLMQIPGDLDRGSWKQGFRF